MDKATIIATYQVAASTSQESKDGIATSSESACLTFQETFDFDATGAMGETSRKHLDSLAVALKTLQVNINTGLTNRLVSIGALSAEEPGEKKKTRTKVAGQTQQQQQPASKKKNKNAEGEQAPASTTDAEKSSTALETTEATTAAEDDGGVGDVPSSMDIDQQVASKKAFGDEEEEQENDKNKDEVDLVMEADPGEIDGACLELPKEGDLGINVVKRQSESSVDAGIQAAKKAKGE